MAHAPWKPSIHWLLVFIPASFLIHSVPALKNDIALVGAVWLTSQISNDGKCNWLNGLQMLILYAIVAALFYFVPVDAGDVLSR